MATLRINDRTHEVLRELSSETAEPMRELVYRAVEAYRRQRIIERTNETYAAMRRDPAVWREELDERAAWDVTLVDGLDED